MHPSSYCSSDDPPQLALVGGDVTTRYWHCTIMYTALCSEVVRRKAPRHILWWSFMCVVTTYLCTNQRRLVILLHARRCANHAIHGRFNPVQPAESADHNLRTSKAIRTDVIRNVRLNNVTNVNLENGAYSVVKIANN